MRLARATEIAQDLQARLSPVCHRVEIAGSIRRGKPEVKDVELVAIPKTEALLDLFGTPYSQRSLLDPVLEDLISAGVLAPGGRAGEKHKRFEVGGQDIALDLFLVTPPAQWGVIFTIRTGPGDFSQWLVTPRAQGGALPGGYQVQDGVLRAWGKVIETPEEEDVFRSLELPYISPAERSPRWRAAAQ